MDPIEEKVLLHRKENIKRLIWQSHENYIIVSSGDQGKLLAINQDIPLQTFSFDVLVFSMFSYY